MKLKIADIEIPKSYLRKPKKTHVDYLYEIAKQGGAPDTWVLDDIEVAPNETPPKVKGQKQKTAKPYELIDGGHRLKVAQRFKLDEIPGKVVNVKDPALRHLEGYKANSSHGLKLEIADRNQFIWDMVHTFNWPQDRIAKETGLHKSSVSRIADKKQGWKGYKPESMKRGKPKLREQADHDAILSPPQFADHLEILLDDFPKQKSEIIAALKDKMGDRLKVFLDRLTAMVKELHNGAAS